MSQQRVIPRSIFVLLCLALLGGLLPGAVAAAAEGPVREYIVSLRVAGSDRLIRPSDRSARERIRQRSARAESAARRLAQEVGFRAKARKRFDTSFTGFAARLTAAQAAELSRDVTVASIRPARTATLSSQVVPTGVRRVKGAPDGGPSGDVDADVLVIDTGIGPTDGDGVPIPFQNAGKPELNIAGGINCFDDTGAERWGDAQYHGTHVAGIIGARDNDVGVVGVAPGVRLWSARAFGAGRNGSESAILCALDWAIETHSTPAPDIDVINMSFQLPRLDYREDCTTVLAREDSDPIHKLVCEAHALGITMVAAAGNFWTNANDVAPGGFDQVISVGSLIDLDGKGWGEATSGDCGSYGPGKDDTYASYSAGGNEVDLIAPGECITSTYPAASGNATTTLSGTSMAAPHVAGAAALWLADRPNTPPEQMRRLLRASGRMDWKARSDPRWSGVNDADDPNRVLDVRALTGGEMLKTWVFHDSFTMGGSDTRRKTRVDVQRGGGYSGTANLQVTDLPDGVGTATFGTSSLDGLEGLDTNLTIRLQPGGADGIFDLGVRVNGPGVSPFSRSLRLSVDRTGPDVSAVSTRIRGGHTTLARNGKARTVVEWQISDELSGVKGSWLQRKIGKQPWRKAGKQGPSRAQLQLERGQPTKLRARGKDRYGNVSTGPVTRAQLVVRDTESSRLIQPASGGWRSKTAKQAFRRSLLVARAQTDSLVTRFDGVAVAVVAAVGPNRGTFRVRVDDGPWTTVDLQRPQTGHRKVVWSRTYDDGPHTLEIQGVQGQTAIDAVLIVREP